MRRLAFLLLSLFILTSGCVKQPEDLKVFLVNVSTDKTIYHSSELVNLSVVLDSNTGLKNVTVMVSGINGRLTEQKTLDLDKGSNNVQFTYTLPRCNVCGGISAGMYDLTCVVSYGNKTLNGSVSIDIQQ